MSKETSKETGREVAVIDSDKFGALIEDLRSAQYWVANAADEEDLAQAQCYAQMALAKIAHAIVVLAGHCVVVPRTAVDGLA